MELDLKDSTWKEMYERIKANDPTIRGELYALFKQWGKVDDTYGDNYIPGWWLAYDMTGNACEDGFEDVDLFTVIRRR